VRDCVGQPLRAWLDADQDAQGPGLEDPARAAARVLDCHLLQSLRARDFAHLAEKPDFDRTLSLDPSD
jgi:hypothetical protein